MQRKTEQIFLSISKCKNYNKEKHYKIREQKKAEVLKCL